MGTTKYSEQNHKFKEKELKLKECSRLKSHESFSEQEIPRQASVRSGFAAFVGVAWGSPLQLITTEDPWGRVPHGPPGSNVGTKASWGTGGQSPDCPARRPAGPDPADQGCGRPHSGVPARGRDFRDCRRARAGLATPRVPAGLAWAVPT